ncbi:MAG: hypothetical protein IK062_11190 [Selenomonadaceae bacterium]|nr:hypothetical protein [Selenomonadaceae bacterium]
MKFHDFGQFLFNSSVFDLKKLSEMISEAKDIQPTFSTAAIFQRFISVSEVIKIFSESEFAVEKNFMEYFRTHSQDVQKKYDEVVQNFLNADKTAELTESLEEPSTKLAQVLVDRNLKFEQFEKILEDYHREEFSPVEKVFADWYSTLTFERKFDYPPSLDVAKDFHGFLTESLKTTIIFSSTPVDTVEKLFGASVKIQGAMPVVIGVLAEQNTLHKLANSYDDFVSEDIEEDFDSVAEMLNVFTGNFTVKVASQLGIEEELYPPLFGRLEKNVFSFLTVTCDFGNFYLYIGEEEIF